MGCWMKWEGGQVRMAMKILWEVVTKSMEEGEMDGVSVAMEGKGR